MRVRIFAFLGRINSKSLFTMNKGANLAIATEIVKEYARGGGQGNLASVLNELYLELNKLRMDTER